MQSFYSRNHLYTQAKKKINTWVQVPIGNQWQKNSTLDRFPEPQFNSILRTQNFRDALGPLETGCGPSKHKQLTGLTTTQPLHLYSTH